MDEKCQFIAHPVPPREPKHRCPDVHDVHDQPKKANTSQVLYFGPALCTVNMPRIEGLVRCKARFGHRVSFANGTSGGKP